MKLQPLTVGPIVGFTSPDRARVWGRGECDSKKNDPDHCFGVAQIVQEGKKAPPRFFKMLPHFDFTGVVGFDSLAPDARYDFKVGYFHRQVEFDALVKDKKFISSLDWSGASTGQVKTAAEETQKARSFVFGSCRYILRLFGGTLWDQRGDKTFRSINRQIDGFHESNPFKDSQRDTDPVPTDLILMIGDQIYADDLKWIKPDEALDEFWSRYRLAFQQAHIRGLMARLPTYMMLDDHEIEDNWSQDRFSAKSDLYAAAIHAYECYQMVHGPAYDPTKGPPDRLWYSFRDGCADFFVLDTRAERFTDTDPPKIIGDTQFQALKAWLLAPTETVKFVVTSVPFFPDAKVRSQDKWSGFPEQRNALLNFIRDNGIRRTVFLSGDVHCSMSAQLRCTTHDDFKVTSIVSSSFFWPYPQGRASTFDLSGILSESEGSRYIVTNAGPVYSADNFTRINVSPQGLEAAVYDRKGYFLGKRDYSF